MKRQTFILTAAAVFVASLVSPTFATDSTEHYPAKPIQLIVPFPAGGAVDILARLIGEQLTRQIGQPVVVQNRPGANGNLAMEAMARAPADGYNLLIGGNGLATNSVLYPNVGYDMQRDFAPVAYVGYAPLIMVVPTESSPKTLPDLVEQARKSPEKFTYASAGNGSSAHLGAELLKYTAKIDMLHIPYKGGAPAIIDLVTNRVSVMLLDPPQSMPHIRSGKLRALAVGSPSRFDLLPEVPTTAEAGYPKLEATVWWGIVAPSKTPEPFVTKLNAEINKALQVPTVKNRLTELGVTLQPGSSAQFGSYLHSEIARWNSLVENAGIQAH